MKFEHHLILTRAEKVGNSSSFWNWGSRLLTLSFLRLPFWGG